MVTAEVPVEAPAIVMTIWVLVGTAAVATPVIVATLDVPAGKNAGPMK